MHMKYYMKYLKTDIHSIMSGDFFAMIIVTLAISVCYLYADLLPSPIPDAVV